VTSGPYHLVRHPIYSGILVAGVGTAVALSWLWLIAVALAGVYFVYSAKVEEHYLTERVPDACLMGCSGRAATSSSAATVSPVTSQLICRRQCPGARSCFCPVIPLWP
jgi:phospholipid methyltransferase